MSKVGAALTRTSPDPADRAAERRIISTIIKKSVFHAPPASTSAAAQSCEMQRGVSDVNQAWEITQKISLSFFLFFSSSPPPRPCCSPLSRCSHAWLFLKLLEQNSHSLLGCDKLIMIWHCVDLQRRLTRRVSHHPKGDAERSCRFFNEALYWNQRLSLLLKTLMSSF